MKSLNSVLLTLIALVSVSACTNGSTATTPPPTATVAGIDTPKSVSVVTAN